VLVTHVNVEAVSTSMEDAALGILPWVENVLVMLNVLCHMTCNRKLYGVLIGSVLAETDSGEKVTDASLEVTAQLMMTAGILQTHTVTQGHGIGSNVHAYQALLLLEITPGAFQFAIPLVVDANLTNSVHLGWGTLCVEQTFSAGVLKVQGCRMIIHVVQQIEFCCPSHVLYWSGWLNFCSAMHLVSLCYKLKCNVYLSINT